jgi:hypothetical protein
MASTWNDYPQDYRADEVQAIQRAACAGDCSAVIGLSGSGKSNLLGFLVKRAAWSQACPQPVLVDCNRLAEPSRAALFQRLQDALGDQTSITSASAAQALAGLEETVAGRLSHGQGICFVLDRFDALFDWPDFNLLAGNLRALRDTFKYRLVYVAGMRRALEPHNELAELFFGHTLWLGPLAHDDAMWSARRDAQRFAATGTHTWDEPTLEKLVALSWGYPALLRAGALRLHPAVERRVAEFWADAPDAQSLRNSRLEGQPLLGDPAQTGELTMPDRYPPQSVDTGPVFDTTQLTAKEHLLLEYLQAHIGQVCEKDDLVRAVWPEDVIYAQGIRDESLAQLVRRLRVKIEPDPAEPTYLHTVPGRGYVFRAEMDNRPR